MVSVRNPISAVSDCRRTLPGIGQSEDIRLSSSYSAGTITFTA